MMTRLWIAAALGALALGAAETRAELPDLSEVTPLTRAHAHNDYEHPRPLFDALEHGFCSIEADIWLVDGELLVAHDFVDLTPERTLRGLYLDPLLAIVRKNDGRVYPGGPGVILLIDIKSAAVPTWEKLHETLADYAEMLTEFTEDGIEERAITAIISGNRAQVQIAETLPRLASIDGRLPDLLRRETSPKDYPMISAAWRSVFSWDGRSEMPEAEREQLDNIVRTAHARGQQVRFWALPDGPETLPTLYEAGVDWLNTDYLGEMRAFLLDRMRESPDEE